MTATVLRTDSATGERHFNWGAAIAGAFAATAVTFFLLTLGSGVGLAIAAPGHATAFLTLGAIYFFAAQAFGFAVGGHLVGRLIGPEIETDKEEEFRAGAHGFVMWAIAIVVSLVLLGLSAAVTGSTLAASRAPATPTGYWEDVLFRGAPNSPAIATDKAEAGRILAAELPRPDSANDVDSMIVARLVSEDAGIAIPPAISRVSDVQIQMRQEADSARKAASLFSLWTAFSLLFGAIVAVAAAISARWMDDKITFSLAPRR